MILYCGDHDERFDTDWDTETHRWCHDTSGEPFSITSEQDHRHECPECHGTWLHANDGCECDDLVPQWMTCPQCERG